VTLAHVVSCLDAIVVLDDKLSGSLWFDSCRNRSIGECHTYIVQLCLSQLVRSRSDTRITCVVQYIPASVWQMLRGSIIVFSGILSVVFLKRKLYLFHWIGILTTTLGLGAVGISSIFSDNSGSAASDSGAAMAAFGVFLVIIGMSSDLSHTHTLSLSLCGCACYCNDSLSRLLIGICDCSAIVQCHSNDCPRDLLEEAFVRGVADCRFRRSVGHHFDDVLCAADLLLHSRQAIRKL
jgi:hypothetical protein